MIETGDIGAFSKLVAAETISAESSSTIINLGRNKTFTLSVDGKCFVNWSDAGLSTPLAKLTAADFTTLEFTAPDQITRAAGSWVDDGYSIPGRTITIDEAAEAANNNTFEIESATATDLTTVETTIETEGASATERVSGTAPLEVDDTALLIPAAGSYTFRSANGFHDIRIYNPDAVSDLTLTIYS